MRAQDASEEPQAATRPASSAARCVAVGALTLTITDADLRYVAHDSREVVRRVYLAVRDQYWNTLQPVIASSETRQTDRAVAMRVTGTHDDGEVGLRWTTQIDLREADIQFRFSGTATRPFWYCNIGLCIHHPTTVTAGRRFNAAGSGGTNSGLFPRTIAPQHKQGQISLPLTAPFRQLDIEAGNGRQITFEFEGREFEIEDHRNWTDSGFKTYSQPPDQGRPALAEAGQEFRQAVTIRLPRSAGPRRRRRPPQITCADARLGTLPSLGAHLATDATRAWDAAALKPLRLAHVRIDAWIGHGADIAGLLRQAMRLGQNMSASLELAAYARGTADLAELTEALRLTPELPIRRLIVLDPLGDVTPPAMLAEVRNRLSGLPCGQGLALLAGTDFHFAELNRSALPGPADGVCFPVTPQVHAADDLSILENLEPQAEVVRAARRKFRGLPVHVTPVNLRPRFNAARRRRGAAAGPSPADARLYSPFGASWVFGSVKYLAEGGAESVTFGDLAEQRGPGSNSFPARAVLRTLASYRGLDVLRCRSSEPLAAIGLHLRGDSGNELIVGNLTPAPLGLIVRGMPPGPYIASDPAPSDTGGADGDAHARGSVELLAGDGGFGWELPEYGIAAFRPA